MTSWCPPRSLEEQATQDAARLLLEPRLLDVRQYEAALAEKVLLEHLTEFRKQKLPGL